MELDYYIYLVESQRACVCEKPIATGRSLIASSVVVIRGWSILLAPQQREYRLLLGRNKRVKIKCRRKKLFMRNLGRW